MTSSHPPRPLDAQFTTALFARIGVDRYTIGESRVGPVFLGWTARGVSAVRLAPTPESAGDFEHWYARRTGRRVVRAVEPDAIVTAAQRKLHDPAAGDVAVDLDAATPLERRVLAEVTRIRAGYARPYELIAAELDEPCSAQTVARVLAENAVPLFVPCHRVVCSDRCRSTGYVFGARAQEALLAAEGLNAAAVDRAIAHGFRYIENDGYFCLPTCGDVATRLDLPGYSGLSSLAEAHARNLRACESCRPVAA